MKVLNKKLKKANKVQKFFYNLTMLLYVCCLGYFIYGLLHLGKIEVAIRIIVITFFAVWFFIYILAGLVSILTKKKKTFFFLTFFTLLLCPLFAFTSFHINKIYDSLNRMNRSTITYTTNLVTLKDTEFNAKSVIGMIKNSEDIEGNILAKELIKKEQLTNKIEYYDDYNKMLQDLYNEDIDGCFITSNYAITFSNSDDFSDINNRVKKVYELSKDMKNADSNITKSKKKTLTEPFSILLMGVDSELDGLKANQAFNGDTLMLVTFNPNTLTATMFSIPRDTFVPIACNRNIKNKINSSAMYGANCVIKTIQNLTGIDIDYYVKINFKGVVDLVNAVGGVEVDVETPTWWYSENGKTYKNQVCEQDSNRRFGKDIVCMNLGHQKLNGEQALAYARCRHLYALSDIARNQHQQQVIEALASKVKETKSIGDFEKILNSVSKNIETNVTTDQIFSLYDVAKNMLTDNTSTKDFSIIKTYLSYYELGLSYTSALGYYEESLNEIVKAMKINLELEKPKVVKTFEISYSEDYTTPLVGYGIYGSKEQVLPSFVGYDSTYVNNWCLNNGITCYFNKVESDLPKDQVIAQSKVGVLLETVSSLTFDVSIGRSQEEEKEEPKKEEPKKEEEKEEPKKEEEKEKEKEKEEPTEPVTPPVEPEVDDKEDEESTD